MEPYLKETASDLSDVPAAADALGIGKGRARSPEPPGQRRPATGR